MKSGRSGGLGRPAAAVSVLALALALALASAASAAALAWGGGLAQAGSAGVRSAAAKSPPDRLQKSTEKAGGKNV